MATVDIDEVAALLARLKPGMSEQDHSCLVGLLNTLVEVTRVARLGSATLARLRRMLGQRVTEKTESVVGAATSETTEAKVDPTGDASDPGEPEDTGTSAPNAAPSNKPKPKRKGHGRIPSSGYTGPTEELKHDTLAAGASCPGCDHGRLFALEPSSSTTIRGQAPFVAIQWYRERLRCGGCGSVYSAPLPPEANGPKYTDSAASTMALLRYGMGLPLNRIAAIQRLFGVPLPASTQWEVVRDRLPAVLPVYQHLVGLAANAEVLHNDDTYLKVLSLMGKRRAALLERNELELPERTGLFTTALVAKASVGTIALFASGRQHAGENLGDLLDRRSPDLPPPIQMCDGLDRNLSPRHKVILSRCLAHGRRNFVDEFENHPSLCAHLLEEVGKVFGIEKRCGMNGWVGEERLLVHQRESGPIMGALLEWINGVIQSKVVEPNSGLGDALQYMVDHWDALTRFLSVCGAPLDNNMSERCLKRAIRHRRSSLFYRTLHGAYVGDIYMAIIYTTELHGGDPLHYLTSLMAHENAVAERPADWLPWNYREAMSAAPATSRAA